MFLLAITVLGGTAEAGTGSTKRLLVLPRSPVVGQRSVIELRGRARAPVYATVGSYVVPGVNRVRLRRAGTRRWRGTYVFRVGGGWTVRVRGMTRSVKARLPAAATFVPPGVPGCTPPSPANAGSHEVLGSGGLWAQLGVSSPHQATLDGVLGKPTKIIWRLAGSGDLSLVAIAPDGARVGPDWLDPHIRSSTWTRPGDEWGSGFTFTQAGCWDIHAMRQDASGDAWVLVRS